MKHLQTSSPNEVSRLLQERKSALVKELNNWIVLRKEYVKELSWLKGRNLKNACGKTQVW